MFYVLKVQAEAIDIVSVHSVQEIAQMKAQDMAYSLVRYEVGDKKAAEAMVSTTDAITADGYYYIAKPGAVTVYSKTTNSGWLRSDTIVTKVVTFMVKEFAATEEPNAANIVISRAQNNGPRLGFVFLDELRGRLAVIREGVSPAPSAEGDSVD